MSFKKNYTYNVFGRFYQLKLGENLFNYRDVLDIVNEHYFNIKKFSAQALLNQKVDAIFIMMNPGSSKPEKKEDDNKNEMVKAIPDPTQDQVMAIMEKMDWQHVRVLNLSDLRNPESGSFYKLFKKVESLNGKKHSIFFHSRKDALEKIWKLKENAPVIVAWGVDNKLNSLIAQCMQYLKSVNVKPIGWLKPRTKNRFYHPYSRDDKNKLAWVRIVLESIGGNKMKTLDEIYGEIWSEPDRWRYYKEMGFDNYPLNLNVAVDFIKRYYLVGGKKPVFTDEFNSFLDQEEGKKRGLHSVSLYFLGIWLEKFFLGQTNIKPDFRYIWFLTSLYHDMGYYFEEKYKKKDFDDDYLKKFKEASETIKSLKYFGPFSDDIILKYNEMLKGKDKEKNRVDHGFFAGSEIYKQLTKNYENVKQKVKEENDRMRREGCSDKDLIKIENEGTDDEEFIYKGLKWAKKQFSYFAKVGGFIAVHNIWFSPPNNKKDYEDNRLSPLIIYNDSNEIDKNKRISVNANPLFALLAIADTIEPLKKFDYNLDVLKKFKIALNYQDREIAINCPKELTGNIKDLQNWLKVSVEEEPSGDIVIRIEG